MSQKTSNKEETRIQIFEEAKAAAFLLLKLKKFLTPSELETLEILLDKDSLSQIEKSLKEVKKGKIKPLKTLLK